MSTLYHYPLKDKRKINGIFILDKPKNFSSNQALQNVKKIFGATKAGHIGTLDPLATGILPIFFGEATKFAQYLVNKDKYYHVVARLGERTDTADCYGKIINQRLINFNYKYLNIILEKFTGNLLQIPPMFSALKYHGYPLYKYARQGISITRKARSITIYNIKLIKWKNQELEIKIHCSKGTYIRTLIDDLGEQLKCGAHVIRLTRFKLGNYSIKDAVNLLQLKYIINKAKSRGLSAIKLLDSLLLPIDTILLDFPIINILSAIAYRFKNGQVIKTDKYLFNGLVRITEGKNNKFIGLGQLNNGYISPIRLING